MKILNGIILGVLLILLPACSDSYRNNDKLILSFNIIGGQYAPLQFQAKYGIVGVVSTNEVEEFNKDGSVTTITLKDFCTGTLIAPKLVLTAAHCLTAKGFKYMQIVFGNDAEQINNFNFSYAVGFKHNLAKGFKYRPNSGNDIDTPSWNDLMIVVLEKSAPKHFVAQNYSPEKLKLLSVGSKLRLAGFGSSAKNAKDYGSLKYVDEVTVLRIANDKREFVLDLENGKRGACHGDSGGPAFIKDENGDFFHIGVGGHATNTNGECNEGIVYTNVLPYLGWIQSEIKNFESPKEN